MLTQQPVQDNKNDNCSEAAASEFFCAVACGQSSKQLAHWSSLVALIGVPPCPLIVASVGRPKSHGVYRGGRGAEHFVASGAWSSQPGTIRHLGLRVARG